MESTLLQQVTFNSLELSLNLTNFLNYIETFSSQNFASRLFFLSVIVQDSRSLRTFEREKLFSEMLELDWLLKGKHAVNVDGSLISKSGWLLGYLQKVNMQVTALLAQVKGSMTTTLDPASMSRMMHGKINNQ